LFADAESDGDGIHFRDRGEQGVRTPAHEVAGFYLGLPHQPVDRRIDAGVIQLDGGGVQGGPRGFQEGGGILLRGQGIVELLA
jgi:hypothetical protein